MQSTKKKASMRGKLYHNYSLRKHTSWHIGGVAEYCYFPADLDDLVFCFKNHLLPEPYLWLGLGSNVLMRDGGFKGTVIMTLGCLKNMENPSPDTVVVQAGVTCAKMARYCARLGMQGAAFFAGIPGTVGGALAMNAGAFGGETWSNVVDATMMKKTGSLQTFSPKDFQIGYRNVQHPGLASAWFVRATFVFSQGDVMAEKAAIRQTLRKRADAQPIGALSCGSVFKNPHEDHAARLIEFCGLKGYRRGGALVSEKHANFILNDANSTAADMEALINEVQKIVKEKTGVALQREVHIIGEPT